MRMYYELVFTASHCGEYEQEGRLFFRSKAEAEAKQKMLEKACKYITFFITKEVSFQQLKQDMTVAEFEEFFGLHIEDFMDDLK